VNIEYLDYNDSSVILIHNSLFGHMASSGKDCKNHQNKCREQNVMSCVSRHPQIKPCMLGLLMCGVCGRDCTLQRVLAGGVRSHLSRRY